MQTTFADVLISAPSIEGLLARLNRPAISVAVTEALELELGLQEPQLVQLLRVLMFLTMSSSPSNSACISQDEEEFIHLWHA